MKTMRNASGGTLLLASLLAWGIPALAEDPADQRPPGASSNTRGIKSVTDGQGNPVDLGAPAVPKTASALTKRPASVQRGQAWWPFATAMPPYTAGGKRVEALTEDEIVVNATATISTRDEAKSLERAPKELLIRPGAQAAAHEGFYLVKIKGFSRTQEQIDELTQAGAVLGEYLNVNTYVAKIPAPDLGRVKSLSFVSSVGDYHPAYKISPRIGLEEIPESEAVDEAGLPKPWVFEVTLHKGVYVNDVLNALAALRVFPEDSDVVSNEALTVILVHAMPELVTDIAQIPGVKFIAEKAYPKLLASSTNPAAVPLALQNNGVYTTNGAVGWKLWNAGIDGSATGQIVTMMDSGLNTKMEHFSQDITANGTLGPAHRKVVGYDAYGGGDTCILDNASNDGGHGAKTSQHSVGSISNMTGNPDVTHVPNANWDTGIARGAKLYFQDIGTSTGTLSPPLDLGPSIVAAIGKGSFVQNHSWGAANNAYDTTASNLDTALVANPNFVVTASSGNRGAGGPMSLGSPSTAKNAICVGGNDLANPDQLFIDCGWDGVAACNGATDLGSSRGPVTSPTGRTKPDIMSYIYASSPVGGETMAADLPNAMCQSDAVKTVYFNYANNSFEGGTSFAAPDVAGLAALTRDYFIQGLYPTGTVTPANVLTPVGSLVKAVLLASGENMLATSTPTAMAMNQRYSSDVGYGRVNLPGVLHIGPGAPFLWVQNGDNLGQGATKSFFYTINSNSLPLRVMMTYYDAAGDALQKDIDLKVTIGANVYRGNNFSGGWSTTATSVADRTNNTEGFFLDASHGLPSSGTVQVDVIGFNNPGGLNYSLVVSGDVTSQAVTQVSMDQGKYSCNETVKITVNDAAATSPVSVTLVSKNAATTTIDTKLVSCSGSNGVFVGTIQTGAGITVADGGSLTASYAAVTPATAGVSCQAPTVDGGYQIAGGCDNAAAGTDSTSSPLSNGGSNEYYTKYMDGGEYSSYSFLFKNTSGAPLTDVNVALSFSGSGASKMTAFNGPVHVGYVPTDAVAGAVFQVYTDPSTAALTPVNMDFDITSPADGYTVARRLTQVRELQTNDLVTRLSQCATFNTALAPFAESTPVKPGQGRTTNPWRWTGSASSPAAVSSENRVDGACGSGVLNAAAMVGNSGTGVNYTTNADSFLYTVFQPSLRGNGPSGQPYYYTWKWHSFYHASEAGGNGDGVWGAFYNDRWNSSTAPTGDQLVGFPLALAWYAQSVVFDYPQGGTGTWNWETANTGTPDDPHLTPGAGGAPNQLIITFSDSVTGPATSSSYFSYGHEHADIYWFSTANPPSHGTHRDVALDNDRLVYDEYYATGQAGASCSGAQLGQVAFNQAAYGNCPTGPATLSVIDANGVSGMTVTVTSPGTGDSEVVTLTGSAPYFSGTVNLSVNSGLGANNGTLFVLPSETISATYNDGSPVGTTVATATTNCAAGNVLYVFNAQASDNGDNDSVADNNETVTIDVYVQNNTGKALTNAKVKLLPVSPTIDCIGDAQASYGTIANGATAINPPGDRFTFHVAPSVQCTNAANPPQAVFDVIISADGLDAPASLQSFSINLDLDGTAGSFSYSQNFAADPGWSSSATADDSNSSGCGPYVNDFHWCSVCGNGGGGYGAWVGNFPFGTANQNYQDQDSSTLYSPTFVAAGDVGLQFDVAYRTEPGYDGAIVQYKKNAGAWTDLPYSLPAQSATTSQDYCSPLLAGETAWTGENTGAAWTTTDAPTISSVAGDVVQFRWRLGSDVSTQGTTYGGLGVDNVSISNLKQFVCEPTRNTGLAGCSFCALNPNGTPCDDGNACTTGDACSGGSCVGTPVTAPGETQALVVAADKTTYSWSAVANATRYDVLRGSLSAFPVGPGGGDEVCFNDLGVTSVSDPSTPSVGTGYWYLSRGENTCAGNGTYGTITGGSPRTSTTCP